MTESRTSRIPLSPAARSSLIIGGLFFAFIMLATLGVMHEAQRIKHERELTKALNGQSSNVNEQSGPSPSRMAKLAGTRPPKRA